MESAETQPDSQNDQLSTQDAEKFKRFVEQTEKGYNEQITILLRAITKAESEGNVEQLSAEKKIAEAWGEYFRAVKENLEKKDLPKDREDFKQAVSFLDGQIKFFDELSEKVSKIISRKTKKPSGGFFTRQIRSTTL